MKYKSLEEFLIAHNLSLKNLIDINDRTVTRQRGFNGAPHIQKWLSGESKKLKEIIPLSRLFDQGVDWEIVDGIGWGHIHRQWESYVNNLNTSQKYKIRVKKFNPELEKEAILNISRATNQDADVFNSKLI